MSSPTILVSEPYTERFGRQLRAAAPNANIVSYGDRADMVAKLPEADGIIISGDLVSEFNGRRIGDIILGDCPDLRWIQTFNAGVERFMPKELAERDIQLTTGSGAHAPAISEHVLALIFSFTRGIHAYVRNQREQIWNAGSGSPLQEVGGKTLCIYGVGRIGTELAQRAHALGMKVYGANLPARPTPDFMEALWAPTRLDDLLRMADFFAVCVGITDGTRHLFGECEFSLMKQTAYFINVGRGGTVDQEALIAALKAGTIAGAGLDVTDPEPLPKDSPLWYLPNVVLTPHTSGSSYETHQRADEIFYENIRRFAAGEPLLNVINPALV